MEYLLHAPFKAESFNPTNNREGFKRLHSIKHESRSYSVSIQPITEKGLKVKKFALIPTKVLSFNPTNNREGFKRLIYSVFKIEKSMFQSNQ